MIDMEISDGGINLIAGFEGFSAVPYDDVGEYPTIGYGHKIRPHETFTSITEDQGKDLLRQDVKFAESAVCQCVEVDLTQNQFDALVSFTYNLGGGTLLKSSLLVALNNGSAQEAADKFLLYNHAGGEVVTGLTKRRTAERELFLTT